MWAHPRLTDLFDQIEPFESRQCQNTMPRPEWMDTSSFNMGRIVVAIRSGGNHGENWAESEIWLGREDSNLRMPVPKTGALGHLATPHPKSPET